MCGNSHSGCYNELDFCKDCFLTGVCNLTGTAPLDSPYVFDQGPVNRNHAV